MLLQGPNDIKTSNYYCFSYLDLEHLGNPSSQLAYQQRDERAKVCQRRLYSTSSSSEWLSDHRKRLPLGLEDGWIDSKGDDETPVLKKKRLSLSLKKRSNLESDSAHLPCATSEKENTTRSHWSFLSEVEELGLAKKCLTKNTATMTKWVLTNFLAWQTSQVRKKPNQPICLVWGAYI